MGKKKDRTGKLPKRIAGVKLPKAARRQVECVLAELKQPIVRDMIAGAVSMTATALAKQTTVARRVPRPEADAKRETVAAAAAKSGGEQFVEIAAGLAVVGLGKLFERMQAAGEGKPAPKA